MATSQHLILNTTPLVRSSVSKLVIYCWIAWIREVMLYHAKWLENQYKCMNELYAYEEYCPSEVQMATRIDRRQENYDKIHFTPEFLKEANRYRSMPCTQILLYSFSILLSGLSLY